MPHTQNALSVATLRELLLVSRGERRAGLVLRGGKVVNVFTREVLAADVAVCGDRIAGVGSYQGRRLLDCRGLYLLPGFMDGHIHVESALLTPAQFSRAVCPHGTTAMVLDPHEIANVAGLAGIRWLLKASQDLPVDFYFMVPSCVPASSMETSGARLTPSHVAQLLSHSRVLGLAEVMDIPGVLAGRRQVLRKVLAAGDHPVDGHAPLLTGHDLNAYVAAGIKSDHETTRYQEALEKLRLGMHLMIREGSLARDMSHLLRVGSPVVSDRSFFVSDDMLPQDLVAGGHMDRILRRAVALGLDPVEAVRMVTLNPANYFSLHHQGGIAPGYLADVVAVEDLKHFRVRWVMKGGRLVARDGRMRVALPETPPPPRLRHSLRARPVSPQDLRVSHGPGRLRVMGLIPDSLLTRSLVVKSTAHQGEVTADPKRDLLKVAVRDRHRRSRSLGVGFVRGFGLKRGALASTVAHDAHNLIAVGADDEDMVKAMNHLIRMGGGMVAVERGRVRADLPLPVGGLLSDQPGGRVVRRMARLEATARRLGTSLPHPFITLSFLALPVIPELKLTDRGLVDVQAGKVVDLFD